MSHNAECHNLNIHHQEYFIPHVTHLYCVSVCNFCRLARRDMVVTTYNIVRSEGGVVSGQKKSCAAVDHSKQVSLLMEKDRFIFSFFGLLSSLY